MVTSTTSAVTCTDLSISSQKNGLVSTTSTEVKEITTTTIVTTTTTTVIQREGLFTLNEESPLTSHSQNHSKPLIVPSGDFQSEEMHSLDEMKDDKPKTKVISLQSLIPNVKAATLQVEDKGGGVISRTPGTKTVLVVNRDGGKVTLQVAAQPIGDAGKGDEVTMTQQSTTTTSTTAGIINDCF